MVFEPRHDIDRYNRNLKMKIQITKIINLLQSSQIRGNTKIGLVEMLSCR